jgi:hypothetical protein
MKWLLMLTHDFAIHTREFDDQRMAEHAGQEFMGMCEELHLTGTYRVVPLQQMDRLL